ncbi:MAG: tautomerase family protein [Candidatus Rokuibacteriota bacterium]
MPDVKIDVRRGWSPGEKKALLEAVHAAMRESLRIPEWDRNQRLSEYAPEDFEIPPGRGDRYTRIEITMFPGRSLEAKRRLYQAIVRNLGALGVPSGDVKIVLIEPPMDNWGVRGGVPASEVDLGYEVKV